MTELEAARILGSQLSGPSARYDAEATLRALGWSDLAIRLAYRQDIGPAGSLDEADVPAGRNEPGDRTTMRVRGFTATGRPFDTRVTRKTVGPGDRLLIGGTFHQVVAVDDDGTVHVGRGYCR
jgi:hypothetical protein